MKSTTDPWMKLALQAREAPAEGDDLPFGFSTRVITRWRTQPRESLQETWQRLTYRGLAVATGILAVSLVFGYETVSNVVGGETTLSGSWLENILAF